MLLGYNNHHHHHHPHLHQHQGSHCQNAGHSSPSTSGQMAGGTTSPYNSKYPHLPQQNHLHYHHHPSPPTNSNSNRNSPIPQQTSSSWSRSFQHVEGELIEFVEPSFKLLNPSVSLSSSNLSSSAIKRFLEGEQRKLRERKRQKQLIFQQHQQQINQPTTALEGSGSAKGPNRHLLTQRSASAVHTKATTSMNSLTTLGGGDNSPAKAAAAAANGSTLGGGSPASAAGATTVPPDSSPIAPRRVPRVGGTYVVYEKIGCGSFGEIHRGIDQRTGEEVAIKFEQRRKRNPHILYECKLYSLLAGGLGIPNIHWYGYAGDYIVMVMDMLGPSLEELLGECKRRFQLKTVLMLAMQMIDRIEFVHSRGIIHRDIKPHNFLMGLPPVDKTLFVIDLGLAKLFRDPVSNRHIPERCGKSLTGTARYVSVNTHRGIEQSRRDDIESLGYVFVYFGKGSLPWQGLKATSKLDRYEVIMRKKTEVPLAQVCHGLPVEFQEYLEYARNMGFTERPNYDYLRTLFRDLLYRKSWSYDLRFEWMGESRADLSLSSKSTGIPSSTFPLHNNTGGTSKSPSGLSNHQNSTPKHGTRMIPERKCASPIASVGTDNLQPSDHPHNHVEQGAVDTNNAKASLASRLFGGASAPQHPVQSAMTTTNHNNNQPADAAPSTTVQQQIPKKPSSGRFMPMMSFSSLMQINSRQHHYASSS